MFRRNLIHTRALHSAINGKVGGTLDRNFPKTLHAMVELQIG